MNAIDFKREDLPGLEELIKWAQQNGVDLNTAHEINQEGAKEKYLPLFVLACKTQNYALLKKTMTELEVRPWKEFQNDEYPLPHIMVEKDDPALLLQLINYGWNIEQIYDGRTPLYLANTLGHVHCQNFLLKNGKAVVDSTKPLRKIISAQDLAALIKSHAKTNTSINLAAELTKKGYDPILDEHQVVIPPPLKHADLSGISLVKAKIILETPVTLNMENTNLTECSIVLWKEGETAVRKALPFALLNLIDSLANKASSFRNTVMNNCAIIIPEGTELDLTEEQKAQVKFFRVAHAFTQTDLTNKYAAITNQDKSGICSGLCRDYARYTLNHPDDNTSYITKLNKQLGQASGDFVARIRYYQKNQVAFRSASQVLASEKNLDNSLSWLEKCKDVEVIGASLAPKKSYKPGHIIAIRPVYNKQHTFLGWKIFEPGCGETGLLKTRDELYEHLAAIKIIYKTEEMHFYDLGATVERAGLTRRGNPNYHKQYSKNVHLLEQALEKGDSAGVAKYIQSMKVVTSPLRHHLLSFAAQCGQTEATLAFFSAIQTEMLNLSTKDPSSARDALPDCINIISGGQINMECKKEEVLLTISTPQCLEAAIKCLSSAGLSPIPTSSDQATITLHIEDAQLGTLMKGLINTVSRQ